MPILIGKAVFQKIWGIVKAHDHAGVINSLGEGEDRGGRVDRGVLPAVEEKAVADTGRIVVIAHDLSAIVNTMTDCIGCAGHSEGSEVHLQMAGAGRSRRIS